MLSLLGMLLLFPKSSNAQHLITSFGASHSWHMPAPVYHSMNDHYYGYDLVHAQRIFQRNQTFFEVVLNRGDVFVNVQVGPRGRVYQERVSYDYPLNGHTCSTHCGYHDAYYRSHAVACHGHHHRGHNHVVYRRTTPSGRCGTAAPGRGHAYGHFKQKKYRGHDYQIYNDHDHGYERRDYDRGHDPLYKQRGHGNSGNVRGRSDEIHGRRRSQRMAQLSRPR